MRHDSGVHEKGPSINGSPETEELHRDRKPCDPGFGEVPNKIGVGKSEAAGEELQVLHIFAADF